MLEQCFWKKLFSHMTVQWQLVSGSSVQFCTVPMFTPGWWSEEFSLPCGWWKSHQRALDVVHPDTGWPRKQTAVPPVGPCVWDPHPWSPAWRMTPSQTSPPWAWPPPPSSVAPLLWCTFCPIPTLICLGNCVICVIHAERTSCPKV